MSERLATSPLFSRDLCGPCDAVRKAWGVEGDIDWSLGVVDRPAAVVRDALSARERAYLLIVNTPDQCVVGGDAGEVAALVADLGATFVPLRGVTTVHCEVVEPVRQAYRDLHVFPVHVPDGVRVYSCAWGRPYDVSTAVDVRAGEVPQRRFE